MQAVAIVVACRKSARGFRSGFAAVFEQLFGVRVLELEKELVDVEEETVDVFAGLEFGAEKVGDPVVCGAEVAKVFAWEVRGDCMEELDREF